MLTSQSSGPGPFPSQEITRSSSRGIARRPRSGEGPADLVAHLWLASCGWRHSCNWHSYLQGISRFQQPCRCRAHISSTIGVSPMSTTRSPRSAGTGGANWQSRRWSWQMLSRHSGRISPNCSGLFAAANEWARRMSPLRRHEPPLRVGSHRRPPAVGRGLGSVPGAEGEQTFVYG